MRRLINLSTIIQSSYDETDYKTIVIGTSDCNEYIPVFAISNHTLLVFKESNIKVMEYKMPTTQIAYYNCVKTYADLIHKLKNTIIPIKYNFKVAGNYYNINIDRGILYDNEGNILLCLSINKDYLFSLTSKQLKNEEVDYTKFVLFISNLLDDPIYKNIKKKINELYIDIAKQIGLDIVITNRINNWLFKNNSKPLKFKTVAKLNKHLKEEIPKKILEMN